MNNKGVTLIEILVTVVVMGIIATISVPAVADVIDNAKKDAIINEAMIVESAAKLYCSQTTTDDCGVADTLDDTQLSTYINGIDDTYVYTATKTEDGYWSVVYNKKNSLSFPIDTDGTIKELIVPSISERDQVNVSLEDHGTDTDPPPPVNEPYVELIGEATVYVEIATSYDDPGANGYASDGSSISSIWTGGSVNFWQLGTYSRTYECWSNVDGKYCQSATRTIIVQDTTEPIIYINGQTTEYVRRRTWWSDQGAWVSDNSYESLTATASGSVNTDRRGTYYITYTTSDSSGNTATATRTVIVY
ncbi:immunoglobulin-like domain-containing protein [Candidatus Izimaplasma bacterium ZiA1]|uniref:immunoglobulin-like domain-containing protein n=1 Tax=Candidatus Izimoplasma sp. ZiA1 TaxID=2024899 RepID=UPI001439F4E4